MLVWTLLAIASFQAGQPFAFADDHPTRPEAVFVDGVYQAENYAKQTIEELKAQNLRIDRVELWHVGDEDPEELQAMVRWFKSEHAYVDYKRVSLAEVDKIIAERNDAIAPMLPKLYEVIRYESQAAGGAPLPPLTDQSLLRQKLSESWASIRHALGIARGISWAKYRLVHRSTGRWAADIGSAAVRVAITSIVLYRSLVNQALHGEQISYVLPILVSGAFTAFFAVFQQENMKFLGQGRNFNFEKNNFDSNRKFQTLWSFIHSFVVRQAIMTAAHVTLVASTFHFSLEWHHVLIALGTSAKGLLIRIPIEIPLNRFRHDYKATNPWLVTSVINGWGIFYACLQIMDSFSTSDAFKMTSWIIAGAATGFEVYVNRDRIGAFIMRLVRKIDRVTANEKPKPCETLLVMKTRRL
jgi:hypothetical protein